MTQSAPSPLTQLTSNESANFGWIAALKIPEASQMLIIAMSSRLHERSPWPNLSSIRSYQRCLGEQVRSIVSAGIQNSIPIA